MQKDQLELFVVKELALSDPNSVPELVGRIERIMTTDAAKADIPSCYMLYFMAHQMPAWVSGSLEQMADATVGALSFLTKAGIEGSSDPAMQSLSAVLLCGDSGMWWEYALRSSSFSWF